MFGEREGKMVSSNRNKCMGNRKRRSKVKEAVRGMWGAESRTGEEQNGGIGLEKSGNRNGQNNKKWGNKAVELGKRGQREG